MNVWEYLCDNRIEDMRFYRPEIFSPYCEMQEDVRYVGERDIAYNCCYRYEEIFEDLFQEHIPKQTEEYLTDLFLHYVMKQEFLLGFTSEEYHIQHYRRQLSSGKYNKTVQQAFSELDRKKQHYVARTLYKQSQIGESKALYAEVMTTLFDPCAVYESRLQKKELLVYLPMQCGKWENQVIKMAETLFLPLGYQVRMFVDRHPGILDETQTMQMDYIEIY